MKLRAAIADLLRAQGRGRVGVRGLRRLGRRGMNLLEIMIVVSIMVALAALGLPALTMLVSLDQKTVATGLAIQYGALRDEALLNNISYRIAYHLEDGYYVIEAGDPSVLLFADAEAREEYESELEDKLGTTAKPKTNAEGATILSDDGEELERIQFEGLDDAFHRKVVLPSGTVFGGVFTPQYGELMEPDFDSELEEEDKTVVYSYILPNGFSEHTVVQIVDASNPNRGWTIEVEPMTGKVHLNREVGDWDDRFDFVPEQGPDLDG